MTRSFHEIESPFVDRLGRWPRRPRTARAIEGGSGVALTGLGPALVTGPLLR